MQCNAQGSGGGLAGMGTAWHGKALRSEVREARYLTAGRREGVSRAHRTGDLRRSAPLVPRAAAGRGTSISRDLAWLGYPDLSMSSPVPVHEESKGKGNGRPLGGFPGLPKRASRAEHGVAWHGMVGQGVWGGFSLPKVPSMKHRLELGRGIWDLRFGMLESRTSAATHLVETLGRGRRKFH
jgi:hypothetical protein